MLINKEWNLIFNNTLNKSFNNYLLNTDFKKSNKNNKFNKTK